MRVRVRLVLLLLLELLELLLLLFKFAEKHHILCCRDRKKKQNRA